jgi:anaerobic selenocysteine-containing dehydrogenase
MTNVLVPTVCSYCGAGCGFFIAVEKERAAGIEYMLGHPVSEGALCSKGNAALEILRHQERLTSPLKGKGEGWDYPFVLTTGRGAVHHNAGSMTPSPFGRELDLRGEINTVDAGQLKVADGDEVTVTTPRERTSSHRRAPTRGEETGVQVFGLQDFGGIRCPFT